MVHLPQERVNRRNDASDACDGTPDMIRHQGHEEEKRPRAYCGKCAIAPIQPQAYPEQCWHHEAYSQGDRSGRVDGIAVLAGD